MHTGAVCDTSPSFSINHKPTEKKTRRGGDHAAAATKVMSAVCTCLPLPSVRNALRGRRRAFLSHEQFCPKNQESRFSGGGSFLINYNSFSFFVIFIFFVLGLIFMRYSRYNACLSHPECTSGWTCELILNYCRWFLKPA